MASRQLEGSLKPTQTNAPNTSGITICVTPPPRLPQPAEVALAVPTTFGANMTEVWYCVMTKEAPMTPMPSRKSMNVIYESAKPIAMTGRDPIMSRKV